MKQLPHVISKLFNEPAVITPARHDAICRIVEARLAMPPVGIGSKDGTDEEVAGGSNAVAYRQKRVDAMMDVIGNAALIRVDGVLVAYPEDIGMSECGCAMDDLNHCIDLAERNEAVQTVIYHFKTPGGVVTRIPETGNKIRSSRKRTIGYCDSECCSGGLWLAAQCRQFYATGSSRIGSVGVYTLCLDMSQAMKKEGVKINAVSAGKYKLLGAYWKPLADSEREIIQARVDKIYSQFKDAMESYRIVQDEHFGNGLVFDGEEAAQIGFTDGVVDSIGDVLEMASDS